MAKTVVQQLGSLFKKLRESYGASLKEVAGRIDLGHGYDNDGVGLMKRIGMVSDFEEGRLYSLTEAHWVNIAEYFDIPMADLIEEKGWPVPSLECAAFVIKKLHEKVNADKE